MLLSLVSSYESGLVDLLAICRIVNLLFGVVWRLQAFTYVCA